MLKLDLRIFGGRGGGSGGIGAGVGVGKKSGGSAGGSGIGSTGGSNNITAGKEEPNGNATRSSTGPVLKLESGVNYNVYRVKEDGSEKEISTGEPASSLKGGLLRGTAPDPSDGLWKDRYGKKYRVVRSK